MVTTSALLGVSRLASIYATVRPAAGSPGCYGLVLREVICDCSVGSLSRGVSRQWLQEAYEG